MRPRPKTHGVKGEGAMISKNSPAALLIEAIRLMGAKHPLSAVRRVFILKMARTS